MMYPLSVSEIVESKNLFEYKANEEKYFKYGLYPGIVDLGAQDSQDRLGILQTNTFYKDIYSLEEIRKPKVLEDILKFLAFSIGSVVTVNGIMEFAKTSAKTVDRYLDILEKMFVIYRLYGYSNNLQNEIKKGFKIYFVDTGLRNSLIDSFGNLENRMDKGGLLENFFIMERIKYLNYERVSVNKYFWQGEKGLEVDFLEVKDEKINAYECKYKERRSGSVEVFKRTYGEKVSSLNVITKDNYLDYLK